MTTTAEFTSTKDENYAQNSGRKGGKYTAKNVSHTKNVESGTSQLLNGEK